MPEIRLTNRRREIVLRLISPEFDPRRIRIQLRGHVLTLAAAALDHHPAHHGYRAFHRSVVLPRGIDWRHISAEAGGQVLTVRIPKRRDVGAG